MAKIYCPAVFHVAEDVEGYWIEFPDLPGCFSQGKNDAEALEMAKDALNLWLDKTDEVVDREIRKPSFLLDIQKQYPDDIVMLIEGDQEYYARKHNPKAVKKTLSISQWLNDKATKPTLIFHRCFRKLLVILITFYIF